MDKTILRALERKTIAYRVDFARIGGGPMAGLFLSQLFYWSDKCIDPDGWVYKTQKEWETELAMTRRNQETVRKKLVESGLIEEKLKGVPARLHYRYKPENVYNALTRLAESDEQADLNETSENGGKSHTREDENALSSITEITTETTPETTTMPAKAGHSLKGEFLDTIRKAHEYQTGSPYPISSWSEKEHGSAKKLFKRVSAQFQPELLIPEVRARCMKFIGLSKIDGFMAKKSVTASNLAWAWDNLAATQVIDHEAKHQLEQQEKQKSFDAAYGGQDDQVRLLSPGDAGYEEQQTKALMGGK